MKAHSHFHSTPVATELAVYSFLRYNSTGYHSEPLIGGREMQIHTDKVLPWAALIAVVAAGGLAAYIYFPEGMTPTKQEPVTVQKAPPTTPRVARKDPDEPYLTLPELTKKEAPKTPDAPRKVSPENAKLVGQAVYSKHAWLLQVGWVTKVVEDSNGKLSEIHVTTNGYFTEGTRVINSGEFTLDKKSIVLALTRGEFRAREDISKKK